VTPASCRQDVSSWARVAAAVAAAAALLSAAAAAPSASTTFPKIAGIAIADRLEINMPPTAMLKDFASGFSKFRSSEKVTCLCL